MASPKNPERVMGIDPGSRLAGYGVIQMHHQMNRKKIECVASGTLKLFDGRDPGAPKRLYRLHQGIEEVIRKFSPRVLVVEKAFFAKNAQSALTLGQARGVALMSAGKHQLDFYEYTPTEIKMSLTGSGKADKESVAAQVSVITGKNNFDSADDSDAIAVAICHVLRCGMDRNFAQNQTSNRKGGSLADALRHRV